MGATIIWEEKTGETSGAALTADMPGEQVIAMVIQSTKEIFVSVTVSPDNLNNSLLQFLGKR